jgi:hypothetical protein
MMVDPRLQALADVIVEVVVRELQKEKSRHSPDKEHDGFGGFRDGNYTPDVERAPRRQAPRRV